MRPDSTEYKIVRDVQLVEETDALSRADALAQVKGSATKPSLAQFQVWCDLVAATEYDVRQRVQSEFEEQQKNAWPQRLIDWVRAFFSSGVLFIVLGIALIAWADHGQDESHTAFTFVYVVLGIAISLYGTGTQAAGAMRSDVLNNGWFQGSMAGGAGVLAFLAGWAIVEKHEEMREAFDQQTKYLRVSFEIGSQDRTIAISPDEHFLTAYHEGLPVLTSSLEDRFIVLLPKRAKSGSCQFEVQLEFVGKDGTEVLMENMFNFVLEPACTDTSSASPSAANTVELKSLERAGADFDEYVAAHTVEFEHIIFANAPTTPASGGGGQRGQNDVNLGAFE